MDNGILAYQEYRAACKIADKAKQLKNQVQLRGNMAKCLLISNKFMEAQLYALSAIQLQFMNSQYVTQEDFFEAKKIFEEVKSGMADATIPTILIKTMEQKNSLFEKKTIHNLINNEVIKISVLKADRKLVRTQTLHTKSLGKEENKIRENLKNIIIKTLRSYDRGEYQKALDALSEEYNNKIGNRLINLTKRDDFIDTEHIIETLLKYGFRSDGIAYLLNLLSDVLSSGKVKVGGRTKKDLKTLAMSVFNGALISEKLLSDARELDDRICELRKKLDKFKNSIITQENKDDSQEMPFQSRLEEIRNITKINRAILIY
jgi:hypothetical protein